MKLIKLISYLSFDLNLSFDLSFDPSYSFCRDKNLLKRSQQIHRREFQWQSLSLNNQKWSH